MLRYKTETRPGLAALYDIRPVNGVGQFLQHWSLHGANNKINQENRTHSSAWDFGDEPLAMARFPQGRLSTQSFGKY